MWCVANEPMGGPLLGVGPPVPSAVEAGMKFFREMFDETRRLTARGRYLRRRARRADRLAWHLRRVCINRYYGWYMPGRAARRRAAELARELDALHKAFGKPIVTAVRHRHASRRAQHAAGDVDRGIPSRISARLFLIVAAQRPFVAGMHVWNFADFKTGQGSQPRGRMNHSRVSSPVTGGPRWPRISCDHDGSRNEKEVA